MLDRCEAEVRKEDSEWCQGQVRQGQPPASLSGGAELYAAKALGLLDASSELSGPQINALESFSCRHHVRLPP